MLTLQVRKIVIQLEETMQEMGREVSPPSRKVTVAAVITNPFDNGSRSRVAHTESLSDNARNHNFT